ncbi:hypothetical protein ABEB36_011507 [Hypothenemus hampei]|uniref:Uncharacterized protein n=1 Tax=Hypothenemus hampei TaxID=57062 RepID=A0ABD1EFX4_HYPHA
MVLFAILKRTLPLAFNNNVRSITKSDLRAEAGLMPMQQLAQKAKALTLKLNLHVCTACTRDQITHLTVFLRSFKENVGENSIN